MGGAGKRTAGIDPVVKQSNQQQTNWARASAWLGPPEIRKWVIRSGYGSPMTQLPEPITNLRFCGPIHV